VVTAEVIELIPWLLIQEQITQLIEICEQGAAQTGKFKAVSKLMDDQVAIIDKFKAAVGNAGL
jgi:hypothetical protein